MADEYTNNAQAHDQPPRPNPALKSLDVMVGMWDLKGCESGLDTRALQRASRESSATTATPLPAAGSGREADTRRPLPGPSRQVFLTRKETK